MYTKKHTHTKQYMYPWPQNISSDDKGWLLLSYLKARVEKRENLKTTFENFQVQMEPEDLQPFTEHQALC